MAGTFGYESEHYELSQQVASLRLFPQLQEAAGTPVAATGAACRMQIAQGTGANVQHPIVLAERTLHRK
jgi:Fe-S oxidoreductase